MSSFLMGCYDPDAKKWCTVTKCSGGYDDAMLARLQKELDVVKISKVRGEWATEHTYTHTHTHAVIKSSITSFCVQDPSKIPNWLKIVKNYYPDFIIRNPEVSSSSA